MKIVLIVTMFIVGTINLNAQNLYEVVSKSRLNVRETPSSMGKVLGTLAPKSRIDVIDFLEGWAVFKYNGKRAYVFSKYIVKVNVTEKVERFKVISASNLNVRHKPSTNSQILGTLQSGSQIEVLSNNGLWAKIRYKNNIGYVSAKYIQRIEKASVVPNESETPLRNNQEIINNREEESVSYKVPATNILEKIAVEFVPNVYCGYSNFLSGDVSPKPSIGGGVDFAFQFIAKENIGFIPKSYFSEASLGYSLRGSAAFPMHYVNLKLLPLGYRYNLSEFALFGKLGAYAGYTFSSIETDYNSFESNIDFGLTIGIGVEYSDIGVGISYERGFSKVCNSNLSLKNSCVFVNVSYRLFSF